MDTVYLRDLKIDTIIGVHDWEQEKKQPLIVSLEMAADVTLPAHTDNIDDAVDYYAVSRSIIEFAEQNQFKLIETFAEKLAKELMVRFQLSWLKLRVEKPEAVPEAATVGVCIERGKRP